MEADALKPVEEQTDSRGHKIRTTSGSSIQDMDLGNIISQVITFFFFFT